jgi:hypothetical protein
MRILTCGTGDSGGSYRGWGSGSGCSATSDPDLVSFGGGVEAPSCAESVETEAGQGKG